MLQEVQNSMLQEVQNSEACVILFTWHNSIAIVSQVKGMLPCNVRFCGNSMTMIPHVIRLQYCNQITV